MIVYVYKILNTSFLDHKRDIIYCQIACDLCNLGKCLMMGSHFLNVTRNPKILE